MKTIATARIRVNRKYYRDAIFYLNSKEARYELHIILVSGSKKLFAIGYNNVDLTQTIDQHFYCVSNGFEVESISGVHYYFVNIKKLEEL